MNGANLDPEVQALVVDAAAWRLFGLLFERPREGWWRGVSSLAEGFSDEATHALIELAAEQASEPLYLEIVGPGGVVSPRETAHAGFMDPGQLLSALSANYDAFAYQPATEECLDHISVEAGFVGYLKVKEAFARSAGDQESAEVAADATRMFIDEHLGPLAWGMRAKLGDDDSFYLALAAMMMTGRVGPVRVATTGVPPWADDDSDEMTCAGGCPIDEM